MSDRATGTTSALPAFSDPKAERAWRARVCLIVPEWGGVKLPGGQWEYSRQRLIAFRDRPYEAVLSALPGAGSPAPFPTSSTGDHSEADS